MKIDVRLVIGHNHPLNLSWVINKIFGNIKNDAKELDKIIPGQ
jgi:hypothetical protein